MFSPRLNFHYNLILRSIFFSFCMLTPTLWEYQFSSGLSFNIFHDSDEILYLNLAKLYSNNKSSLGIYKEHSQNITFQNLLSEARPDHSISHYALGKLANILGLNILQINIILDFLFLIPTYLFLSYFFFNLTHSRNLKWEIVTITVLALPYLTSIENYISLTPLLNNSIVFESLMNAPFILEALESQFSIFWMSVCLWIWSINSLKVYYKVLLLGIFHGLFMYIYILGWISFAVFFPVLIFLDSIKIGTSLKKIFLLGALFFIPSTIISSFGIIWIIKGGINDFALTEFKQTVDSVFYLPTEWIVICLLLLTTFFYIKTKNHNSKPLLLIVSLILSELIILNIQPIFRTPTAGLYISCSYLRPLLTGMFLIIIFNCNFRIFSKKNNIRLLFGALNIIILSGSMYTHLTKRLDEDHVYAVRFLIDSKIKNKTLAILSFDFPFSLTSQEWDLRWIPNAFGAITDNYILHESLYGVYDEDFRNESLQRELLLGLIFKGTPTLIRSCPEKIIINPPQLYFLPWMWMQASRKEVCEGQIAIIENPNSCLLVTKFSVDYIILETNLIKELPEITKTFSTLEWKSPKGLYELYSYDRNKATKYYCESLLN
jgi:hypothetical protein